MPNFKLEVRYSQHGAWHCMAADRLMNQSPERLPACCRKRMLPGLKTLFVVYARHICSLAVIRKRCSRVSCHDNGYA